MVVVEPIDLREEHHYSIRITKREIRIFKNLLEKIRKMICLREFVESLDIEISSVLVRELGIKKLRPCISLVVIYEKARYSSELSTRTILVIHELVDECIGDLVDLSFWIRYFSDEDIPTGIDTILGNGSEHIMRVSRLPADGILASSRLPADGILASSKGLHCILMIL